MNHLSMPPIIEGLIDPSAACRWPNQRWDTFLRTAGNLGLLSKFAFRAEAAKIENRLPETVREQLIAARQVAEHHRRMVDWEVHCLRNILSYQGIEFILLKGAAYIMAGLQVGRGRKVNDIDILVRREDLERTEQSLRRAGWGHIKLDPYDQRYYRRWMHELPPLKHQDRKTLVDVHHNILPESGRLHPDPKLLWARALVLGPGKWQVLSKTDMVLHSAAHLFQDGNLDGGLRDLFDLDDLMRHFGEEDPDFWKELIPRATVLDLARPTFYALHFCRDILGTPVPAFVMEEASADAPNRITGAIMTFLGRRTLVLPPRDGWLRSLQWEKNILHLRSHWLRMPPLLLARHVSQKIYRRSDQFLWKNSG